MCVGVICASLPAASYAIKNSNSIYRVAWQKSFSFVSSGHKGSQKTEGSSAFLQSKGTATTKSTDRKYAPYYELDDGVSSLAPGHRGESKYEIEGANEPVMMKEVQVDVELGRPDPARKRGEYDD
jgi:hypothetical protein